MDQEPVLFNLVDDADASGGPMGVLLNAIEANPRPAAEAIDHALLNAFLQDRADPSSSGLNHPTNPTTGAGMSISSLLAASQQLASPETTFSGANQAARASRPAWVPTSSALASFQDDGSLGFQGAYGIPSIGTIMEQQAQAQMGRTMMEVGGVASGSTTGFGAMSRGIPVGLPQQQQQVHAQHQQQQPILKRKWDEIGVEEKRAQIRRSIETNAAGPAGTSLVMSPSAVTTVLCLHASVAQKSYGNEKRFLCPPPMVKIDGPMRHLGQKPRLMMSIISESGERRISEQATLGDAQMKAYFRQLYVSGMAKAKSFSLSLTLHPPPTSTSTLTDLEQRATNDVPLPPHFASFDSANVAIISKPSKKTAKARNTTSCIPAGSTIALFNRINSQTVRTKFMAIDEGKLAARTSQWTAFSIHILRRAEDTIPGIAETLATSKVVGGANTVTYGSEILLTDLMTGVSSEPLIVRKVEKNRVVLDATGPVSQMQKLALGRVATGARDIYLSAAVEGMDAWGNEFMQEGKDVREGKKRRKEGVDGEEVLKPVLVYQSPKCIIAAGENGGPAHEIDDYMAWTVIGITSFSYSFFDAYGSQQSTLPSLSITPFPTFTSAPMHQPTTNTLSVAISHFYHMNPSTGLAAPLELWLGPLGPLKTQIIGPSTDGTGFSDAAQQVDAAGDPSAATFGNETFVSIELPSFDEMVRATTQRTASEPRFEDMLASSPMDPPQPGLSTYPSTSHDNDLDRSLAALSDSMNASAGASSFASTSSLPAPAPFPSSTRHIAPLPRDDPPLSALPVSLPLIIVRPTDGTGYMTGRWVVAEQGGSLDALLGEKGAEEDWENGGTGGRKFGGWQIRIA